MHAIGAVVRNRVAHPDHPDGICAVVTEGGETPPCQFSFWCDGLPDQPVEEAMWQRAQELAGEMLRERPDDPTQGALLFHSTAISPDWAQRREPTVRIGNHLFYR